MNTRIYLIGLLLGIIVENQSFAQINVGSKNTVGILIPADSTIGLNLNANYGGTTSSQNRGLDIRYNVPANANTFFPTTAINNIYSNNSQTTGTQTDTLKINSGISNQFYNTMTPVGGEFREHRGISNVFNSQTKHRSEGIYNNSVICDLGTKYGMYNHLQLCDTSITVGNTYKAIFGIYNYVNIKVATGEQGTTLRTALYSGIKTDTSNTNAYAAYFQGNVMVVGKFTRMSDANLKNNITTLSSALTQINALHPCTFYYNNTVPGAPGGLQYGLLAQELETIYPAMVSNSMFVTQMGNQTHYDTELGTSYSESNPTAYSTYKTIDYIALIPVLIKAIQEQDVQINQLKTQISELKSSVK